MERRQFSEAMQGKNLRFMAEKKAEPQRQRRVGFVLLEHFSLPAFTQALDTLVTANLIREGAFSTHTFSLDGEPVTSDLGLVICPSAALESRHLDLDLLVVCGGLRTPLRELPSLNRLLQLADDRGVDLAGLWNGAWFLGKAGLLDCHKCAVHPENRAALAEVARNSVVTAESYIVDGNRLTAGSPAGAFNMVLEWINRLYGRELVDGVGRTTGCRAEVEIELGEPLLVNDDVLARRAGALLGRSGLNGAVELRSCGADDFAFYAEKLPSLMMFVGTGSAAGALHSAQFLPSEQIVDDTAIALLAGVLAAAEAVVAGELT